MNTDDSIPNGFVEIHVQSAFVNRQTGEIVLLGIPEDGHNCDEMGCGSLDHVVFRVISPTRAAEQRNEAVATAQKCPFCSGLGFVELNSSLYPCNACDGTGISKRA